MKLETLIGLEFHVQLKTATKMFCACKNDSDKVAPNTNICPICTGHPGVLPQVNDQAIKLGIKASLAINCEINKFTKFDRKNYFYPDLPKGYQISQFDKPLAEHGSFVINKTATDGLAGRLDDEKDLKTVRIIRLHLEEDSAKSIHDSKNGVTLVDYNRGGAPLIEIVTAPDMSSPSEAKTFAQELQLLMRDLNISNADMEKGELRCDANISLRPVGDHELYTKTEIKNINSFKSLEKALEFEVKRQTLLWMEGKPPTVTETRGYDDKKQETIAQRTKEGAADYRFFPEPDIPPITFTDTEIKTIKRSLGELPQNRRQRFMDEYSFSPEDAKILTYDKDFSAYTEQVISELHAWAEDAENNSWKKDSPALLKLTSNWLVNNLLAIMSSEKISLDELKVTPENFAEFVLLNFKKLITSTNAVKILNHMVQKGSDPSQVMKEYNFTQTSSSDDILPIIEKVINDFPEQVAQFKAGKDPVIQFLLGQVMKQSKGTAQPAVAEKLLREKLK